MSKRGEYGERYIKVGDLVRQLNQYYGTFKNDSLSIIGHIKPTHGNCCTCQTCGYSHDDCVCEHNHWIDFLGKHSVNVPTGRKPEVVDKVIEAGKELHVAISHWGDGISIGAVTSIKAQNAYRKFAAALDELGGDNG